MSRWLEIAASTLRFEIAASIILVLLIIIFIPHHVELNRLLLLFLPAIAVFTAIELYTNDQALLAYSHDLQTCNHALNKTLQGGVVQAHRHNHHMAAVRANLRECLEERDVLRRNEKECYARDKVDEESVQWIEKMIREDVCAIGTEGKEEKEK
ncbi:hypothetical protein J4E85_010506 [Alternaria conjuncta]|uniref:uncharacterized protein n=1 Tax=Alternaria conjuncta TaxID=181017 RepID=UPI00221F40C3|nr:uncharacterized protein J4E85_010506 [Alternaria conjuncta]KAI4914443.1 hypothetical protein J4E85_010506 [Alternaria conjuncta]